MKRNEETTIYIVSGPCGAGKSTITKQMAKQIDPSALIEGDLLLHMCEDGNGLTWSERLSLKWQNLLSITRNFAQHDLNIIIDTVVEDELAWFCGQLSDLNVNIKYVVLRADENILIRRLKNRGNPELIDRSLFLLNQLENESANHPYLFDTTNKKPADIATAIIQETDYYLSNL